MGFLTWNESFPNQNWTPRLAGGVLNEPFGKPNQATISASASGQSAGK
jgi:hypothetical protein